jgi:hypothetical protein
MTNHARAAVILPDGIADKDTVDVESDTVLFGFNHMS